MNKDIIIVLNKIDAADEIPELIKYIQEAWQKVCKHEYCNDSCNSFIILLSFDLIIQILEPSQGGGPRYYTPTPPDAPPGFKPFDLEGWW